MSRQCTKCQGWIFFDSHKCPPAFEVRQVYPSGDVDDWRTFYALDAEQAAEKWAERYDSYGDYTIVQGSPATVDVQDSEGKATRFIVHGESVPSYSAHEETPRKTDRGAS